MFERCLYFNSQNLARTISRIWTKEFKKFGLSPPHAYLLRLVLAEPGLLQREIAEELGISKSTVTRFIDSLEAQKLLSRKTGGDAREQTIYPTNKARGMQQQLESSGEALYREMQKMIGTEELKRTVGKMRKIQSELAE